MNKTTVGVKLEPEVRERLKALGEARQRSSHWLMKEAITRYLDEEEEQGQRDREALEAWEEFEQTGKYVAHEDMEAWLKSKATNGKTKPPRTRTWRR